MPKGISQQDLDKLQNSELPDKFKARIQASLAVNTMDFVLQVKLCDTNDQVLDTVDLKIHVKYDNMTASQGISELMSRKDAARVLVDTNGWQFLSAFLGKKQQSIGTDDRPVALKKDFKEKLSQSFKNHSEEAGLQLAIRGTYYDEEGQKQEIVTDEACQVKEIKVEGATAEEKLKNAEAVFFSTETANKMLAAAKKIADIDNEEFQKKCLEAESDFAKIQSTAMKEVQGGPATNHDTQLSLKKS